MDVGHHENAPIFSDTAVVLVGMPSSAAYTSIAAMGAGHTSAHSNRFSSWLFNSGDTASNAATAVVTLAALEHLRANDSGRAIEILETELDGALIGLWGSLRDTRPDERSPTALKAIRKAKDYRTRFPSSSTSPEVKEVLLDALSLGDSAK